MARFTKAKSPGTPTWLDLMSTDPTASQKFYHAVFGWNYHISGPEFGHYAMAHFNNQVVAGIGGQPPDSNMPTAWTIYFASADLAADIAKAEKLGAKVFVPPMKIGDNGSMAMLTDPLGGFFGLWQAGTHVGTNITDEHGSMTWHELYATDAKKARDFYTKFLNASSDDMPGGMEYYMLKHGDDMLCGIMQSDPKWNMPTLWGNYFAVRDIHAAVKVVQDNGGKIMGEIEQTPFGPMAALIDPQGGMFKIIHLQGV